MRFRAVERLSNQCASLIVNSDNAAGLDVFVAEPQGQTELAAHPHVVCTPHVGAQTVEAQARAADDIASEILAALREEKLRWQVA